MKSHSLFTLLNGPRTHLKQDFKLWHEKVIQTHLQNLTAKSLQLPLEFKEEKTFLVRDVDSNAEHLVILSMADGEKNYYLTYKKFSPTNRELKSTFDWRLRLTLVDSYYYSEIRVSNTGMVVCLMEDWVGMQLRPQLPGALHIFVKGQRTGEIENFDPFYKNLQVVGERIFVLSKNNMLYEWNAKGELVSEHVINDFIGYEISSKCNEQFLVMTHEKSLNTFFKVLVVNLINNEPVLLKIPKEYYEYVTAIALQDNNCLIALYQDNRSKLVLIDLEKQLYKTFSYPDDLTDRIHQLYLKGDQAIFTMSNNSGGVNIFLLDLEINSLKSLVIFPMTWGISNIDCLSFEWKGNTLLIAHPSGTPPQICQWTVTSLNVALCKVIKEVTYQFKHEYNNEVHFKLTHNYLLHVENNGLTLHDFTALPSAVEPLKFPNHIEQPEEKTVLPESRRSRCVIS